MRHDRVNIGNARLYGMEKDLGLDGNKYQIAVSLLFVTYIVRCLPPIHIYSSAISFVS